MQGYGVTAQYYDPLMSAAHADVDKRIAAVLADLEIGVGPVVDIGAGTGLSTSLIASVLPDADILAIEPDPSMRAALMARIWSDEDLRARVSILPFDGLSAPLPDRISGAVLSASLVHFSSAERSKLLSLLAERLGPTGRIIAELQCPTAVDIPETDMGKVQVGQIVYGGSAMAERIAGDRQRWTVTYHASLEGHEIARGNASYDCWTISADDLVREAAAFGLDGHVAGDLVVLQHRSQHA